VAVSPALSQGHGKGGGGGNGHGGGHGGGSEHGGGPGKAKGGNGHGGGGGGPAERGGPNGGKADHVAWSGGPGKAHDHGNDNGHGKGAAKADRRDDGPRWAGREDKGRGRGADDRRGPPERVADNGREVRGWRGPDRDGRPDRVTVRFDRHDGGGMQFIQGCPPGLAKKGNGCLPPGQARKLYGYGDPYANWYGEPYWLRDQGRYDWRYDNGYAYRIDPTTSLITGFLPLLGGALFTGNAWPTSLTDYDVPSYYDDFYGRNAGYDYRYADDTIFAVDPKTQAIQAIVGLLAGDGWNVGSRMPAGYDLYNVPLDYRDRYADSDDRLYRYSDGYVYGIDPTTQLVQQAIQLIV
jgi:hypothetical protein